jgi:hypothetical protein
LEMGTVGPQRNLAMASFLPLENLKPQFFE